MKANLPNTGVWGAYIQKNAGQWGEHWPASSNGWYERRANAFLYNRLLLCITSCEKVMKGLIGLSIPPLGEAAAGRSGR